MKRSLLVYLVDPVHNYIASRDNWMIPLNILNLAAMAEERFGDTIQVRCFKFADEILTAMAEELPDIVGSSNYIWNEELAKLVINTAKELSPDTLTLMGGPNIVEDAGWMTGFFGKVRCDFYTQGEGEEPFCDIIGSALEHGCDRDAILSAGALHSVWYAGDEARFIPSKGHIENLDTIPSPFQAGLVKEFFDKGLTPTVETNRGCPFSCTYCVWGTGTKVRQFSTERVKSDLTYCRGNASDDLLMINDANFGLFERDLEIATFLKEQANTYGWPKNVIVNWGQVKSERALDIAEAMKGICIFRQSSQSMNPDVLKNIKRKNVSAEQWHKSISHCKGQGLESFGELILMLPGETFESYVDGLRILFNYDVDCINTNQLQLLNGAPMNTPEQRELYGMKTKWRLFENAYGVYSGKTAIESVELVCQTNTLSEEECYLARPLSWLIQMSWTLKRHDLLVRLLANHGVNPADFFLEVINQAPYAHSAVAELFEEFMRETREELFESREELIAYYSDPERMEELRTGGFKKMNTHYSSFLPELNKEFMDLYEAVAFDMAKGIKESSESMDEMIRQCCRFQLERNIDANELERMEKDERIEKTLSFDYDFLHWGQDAKGKQLEHGPTSYLFYIDEEQHRSIRKHMEKFSGISREYQLRKLHEPFYGIDKKNLLFRIKPVRENS